MVLEIVGEVSVDSSEEENPEETEEILDYEPHDDGKIMKIFNVLTMNVTHGYNLANTTEVPQFRKQENERATHQQFSGA